MGRALLILARQSDKDKAIGWVQKAPWNTRLTFQGPKRSVPQNSRFWAMLSDIATQVAWHGVRLEADDWKLIFMDALKQEVRLVPNINGNGFVNLGRSSSKLSKSEMSELQELMAAFGAQHGVVFQEERADGVDNG